MLPWFRKLPLFSKVGYILATINFMGFFVLVVQYWSWEKAGEIDFLLTKTSMLYCLGIGGYFLVTAKSERLRLVQPFIGLLVGLFAEVGTPGDSSPIYFFIVAFSLFAKYDYFRYGSVIKAIVFGSVILGGGVLGAFLAPGVSMEMFVKPANFAYYIQFPFMNVCLLMVELSIFWEDLRPYLFPVRAPQAEPVYFVAQEYGLTERQFEVLELIVRMGRDTKQAASELGVDRGTVDKHMQAIYTKLGVGHSRAELVGFLANRPIVWDRETAEELLEKFRKLRRFPA